MLTLFEHILNPLLGMSVTAAFVAVVVILLRLILKKRAPKQVVCLLWLLVFARLLVPVMVESPISLVPSALEDVVPGQVEQVEDPALPVETPDPGYTGDAPVNTPVIPETSTPTPGNVVTTPSAPVVSQPVTGTTQDPVVTPPVVEDPPVLEAPSEPETPAEPPVVEEPAAPVWMYIVPAVWLAGVAVMLAVGIGSYVKLRRRVYDAIRTADGVWEHPSLASPFILGLIRPKIYLPMGIEGQPRQFILHHERAHLRRLDHVVKPICWLALAIHWFNPLAWVAFLLMSRDIETACDESVIRKLGSEVKADYSATLLALATDKRFPAPSPLSFGEGDAKVRIKNVLSFKKPALWVTIAAVVVAVIAAVCLLTDRSPGLDYYYPEVDWDKVESTTASFRQSDYPMDMGEITLSNDASAEVIELLHQYRYWKGISHWIPDNRIGFSDSVWKLQFNFESELDFEITPHLNLNYSESGTLVVYYYDGVKSKAIHYTIDKEEELTQAVLAVINRELRQMYTAELGAAMKGMDGYSEELPALLAALIPAGVEFSYEDPLTADDCSRIFAQALWYSGMESMVETYGVSLFYIDLLLPEFLANYDRVEWNDYSEYISEDASYIHVFAKPEDQRGLLAETKRELVVPHTSSEAEKILKQYGLDYHGETVCDVTVAYIYTDGTVVRQTFGIMFEKDAFKILSVTDAGSELAGYTTKEEYPGLYFLEEPSSTVGTKITAYKLVDGELVLVGGYDEHMANNFYGLIGPDGEEEAIFASPQEVYAMFEELLAAACLEMDPEWTPPAGAGTGETEISDYELTVHWHTLKEYTYKGETYPMEPVALQLDLPQPITFRGGTLLGAEGEEIGYMALMSVDEDLELDEDAAALLGMFAPDGTLTAYDGEDMTFSTPRIRAGYDTAVYTSGSGPDALYAYIRVSPTLVLHLSLQGEEYLTQWERCLLTLQVESGITYDTADMTLLASLPERELYIYKHSELLYPFLVYKGQQKQLNGTIIDTWLPVEFYPADRNGDGAEEIVIRFNQGHGTGLMEDGLLACQLFNGQLLVNTHDWSGLARHFNANNSFTYDPQTRTLSLSYGGYTATVVCPDYVDLTGYGSSAVITGEQVRYTSNGDGSFTLSLIPAFSNGDPLVQYFDIELQCTVRYDGYSFRVTEAPHLVCKDLREDAPLTGAVGDRFLTVLDGGGRILSYGPSSTSGQFSSTMEEILDGTLQITQIAALDLDGDGIMELLLQLETPSMFYGTEILHYNPEDGRIYGYMLWVRGFNSVKTDGTFVYSDSAFVSGVARLSFSPEGYVMEKISYSEEDFYYYVNKQPATEQEFYAAFAAQQEKPDLVWTEYTPVNAETLIREHFEVTENAPPSSLAFLASLPFEIVTSDTLPTDPEEYYLVAELPESHVYLYARNHGQDSMLLWNGNFWWPMEGRVAHTGHMNLPAMYLLKETASTTDVAVVSEVNTGTGVGMDELVVYVMGGEMGNIAGTNAYTGMQDYIYDWRPIAKEFNENNTLVYDADTNSLTLFWNGTACCTGTLAEDLGQSLALEDGFTGTLTASGDILRFTPNGDGSFTATMQTAIAGRPMSIGITGFELTWTVAFTGSGFETSAPVITVTGDNAPYLRVAFPEEGIYLFAFGNGGEYYCLFEGGQLHKVPGAGILTDLDVNCQMVDLDGDGQMELAVVGNHHSGSSSASILSVFDKSADGWKHYRLPSYYSSNTTDYVSPFGGSESMRDAATFTIGSDPTQVTMHLGGFDFPFTVSDEVAARSGDYYVWDGGRSITWEGDGYYLRLMGGVHRRGGQYGWPSDDCGVTFQFVCRLEYNADGTFEQIPVGITPRLPVYSNTMTGGYQDLYAVLEDGTLLMWGRPEFTEGLTGAEYGEEPLVLMENVAAVYCGSRGTVAAVDKDGNLWALDVVDKFKAINPDISRESPYDPVWVMDDVATVSIDFLNTLVLKRDGTLWELSGSWSMNDPSFTKIMDNVVNALAYGYGGYAITGDGTLWKWELNGPEPYGPVVVEENADWEAFRSGLNEDGSITRHGVTIPDVVQVSGYFVVQADGTLWNWGDERNDDPPVAILEGVSQIGVSESGILVLKQDGTYWYSEAFNFGSYSEREFRFIQVYPLE